MLVGCAPSTIGVPRAPRRSILSPREPEPAGLTMVADEGMMRGASPRRCRMRASRERMGVIVAYQRAHSGRWDSFSRTGLVLVALILAPAGRQGSPVVAVEMPGADGSDRAARGPLRIHPANPRYFTDGSGRAVFLTGSHTWGNLQDYSYATVPSPPPMDFDAYLAFLKAHNHNFFRLWAWEMPSTRTRSRARPPSTRCPTSGRGPARPWTASRSST